MPPCLAYQEGIKNTQNCSRTGRCGGVVTTVGVLYPNIIKHRFAATKNT